MNKTTIYFKYGSMNSGKSLELMKVAYNYEENGLYPLILKPKVDTRAKGEVISRVGLTKSAYEIDVNTNLKNLLDQGQKVILVDEAQFLEPSVIDNLVELAYKNGVFSLMFFGLKADFRGNLFEGSKRIIEVSDKIEESTSICWCGKKARQNARVVDGKLIKTGPTVLVDDGNAKVEYITLCNYHYFFADIGGSFEN